MTDPHTNFYHPTIIGYWILSHICYWEQSLHMRRVTWPVTRGQKWCTFL